LIPNTDANEWYYIYTGLDKLYWKNDKEDEIIFGFCMDNEVFFLPDEFFLGIKNQDVYLEMLEDTEVYILIKAQMDEMYKKFYEARIMNNTISASLAKRKDLYTRILTEKEGDRYALFCKWFPKLRKKNLPDKVLMDFLRVSRTTLFTSRTDYHIEERKCKNRG
jgi:hypothetical protein